jgi:hypothetical protein
MFRKLLLTSVASLGVLSPVAVTTASAHEFHPGFRHEHRREWHHERAYRVFYRDPCRPGWTCAGTFCNHREAERCAEGYRCRGFATSID